MTERAGARTVYLSGSNDLSTWDQLAAPQSSTGNYSDQTFLVSGTYRYVRMVGAGSMGTAGFSLFEFEVYQGVPLVD